MRIMEIIKKMARRQEPKEICLAQEPVKMTIVPVSMEQVAEEVDMVMPKKARKSTFKVSKGCTTNTAVKNKKRYSPVIKTQEDFNKEMQAAYNRLNYLRSKAKELGIKKVKTKKGRKNILNRSAKVLERDRDYHFFTFWVRDRCGEQLEKKYLGLKKASIDSSKEFTAFHGRLFDTVQKFGTAEEKDYVLSLMEKEY